MSDERCWTVVRDDHADRTYLMCDGLTENEAKTVIAYVCSLPKNPHHQTYRPAAYTGAQKARLLREEKLLYMPMGDDFLRRALAYKPAVNCSDFSLLDLPDQKNAPHRLLTN